MGCLKWAVYITARCLKWVNVHNNQLSEMSCFTLQSAVWNGLHYIKSQLSEMGWGTIQLTLWSGIMYITIGCLKWVNVDRCRLSQIGSDTLQHGLWKWRCDIRTETARPWQEIAQLLRSCYRGDKVVMHAGLSLGPTLATRMAVKTHRVFPPFFPED